MGILDLFPGKWWLYTVAAGVIFASGAGSAWQVQSWRVQSKELAELQARESDAIQQRRFSDKASGTHAAVLAALSTKLGAAYATNAKLSGRDCLDPSTVGVLNAIGGESVPATPGQPASQTSAPATAGGLRFSTNIDLANFIAFCRVQYAEVNSQLNQILDIEDKRNPLPK